MIYSCDAFAVILSIPIVITHDSNDDDVARKHVVNTYSDDVAITYAAAVTLNPLLSDDVAITYAYIYIYIYIATMSL